MNFKLDKFTLVKKLGSNLTTLNASLVGKSYMGTKSVLNEDDFIKLTNGSIADVLLPNNICSVSPDLSYLVVKTKSTIRKIRFTYGSSDHPNYISAPHCEFLFNFPELYYGINKNSNNLYQVTNVFLRVSHESFSPTFIPFPFFNIFTSSNVCTNFSANYDPTGLSFIEEIDIALDEFWNSVFNVEVKDFMNVETHARRMHRWYSMAALKDLFIEIFQTLINKEPHLEAIANTVGLGTQHRFDEQGTDVQREIIRQMISNHFKDNFADTFNYDYNGLESEPVTSYFYWDFLTTYASDRLEEINKIITNEVLAKNHSNLSKGAMLQCVKSRNPLYENGYQLGIETLITKSMKETVLVMD